EATPPLLLQALPSRSASRPHGFRTYVAATAQTRSPARPFRGFRQRSPQAAPTTNRTRTADPRYATRGFPDPTPVGVTAIRKFTTGRPDGVYRSSGSSSIFPISVIDGRDITTLSSEGVTDG